MSRELAFRFAGVLIFLTIIWLFFEIIDDDDVKKHANTGEASGTIKENIRSTAGLNPFSDTIYPDAPNPDTDVIDFNTSKRLWPDITEPLKTQKDKDKVREQWMRFAAKYPDNIFIPSEFSKPLSEPQRQAVQGQIDLIGDIESGIARTKAKAKYATPGTVPEEPEKSNISPEQQREYIDYKIKETSSKIELIEFLLEEGNVDPETSQIASEDLQKYKNELNDLQKVLKSIPEGKK